MELEDESDQGQWGSDDDSSDEHNKIDNISGHNVDSENGMDKRRKNRREKGPPIVCLMCKTVWTKSRRGGRLFMFGGTRPFMAKFEAKFKALMGREDLTALQNRAATKFGRSYICRECYLLVRQTYDHVRKLQRNVAKSLQKAKSVVGLTSCEVKEDEDSGSDQDLDYSVQSQVIPRKKLPPVAERIAEKIANLMLVKINSKFPRIILKRVAVEEIKNQKEESDYDEEQSEIERNSESDNGDQNVGEKAVNNWSQQTFNAGHLTMSASDRSVKNGEETGGHSGMQNQAGKSQHFPAGFVHQPAHTDLDDFPARTHMDSVYTRAEVEDCSAISLNTDTSFASQHTLTGHSVAVLAPQTADTIQPHLVPQLTQDLPSNSTNSHSPNKSEELAEILTNPLLLVKSPQPIKLADVKNENIYICGEGSCDWIFSSKFFWENHIRHYHRSGRPFICSFDGCGRSFTGKSKLELHERSHTDERPFICDKCGSGFRGNQELRAHKLTHTSDKPHQCPKCDKNFKLLSSLKRHLQFHDGGDFPYPCTYPACEKAFKSRYDLKCHYRLHTGEKPYKCPEPGCGMTFRIPCQFTMHKRSHTGERPFSCTEPGCSAAYISSNALQAHMLSHTSDRPFCCEFCGKTFKHKMLYRMHLKKHSGPASFLCPVDGCGQEFADRSSIDQHMAAQHGIHDYKPQNKKVYECPEEGCGLKYSTEGGLRYHRLKLHKKDSVKTEEGEELDTSRRLICPFDQCEKEYEEANDLDDHLTKAHMTIPREKMCPLCGSAFPYTEQLTRHTHRVHSENSELNDQVKGVFVCNSERCGVRFHRLEELKHHVTWHLGNPPYRCEVKGCGRTFLLESMSSNHIREHEMLKPFTCSFDHCQEGFTSRTQLLKHSKLHYGLFRCPIDGCTKSLQTLSRARLHLQRHEKPFVCMLCGKQFSSSSLWTKHHRSHTGEKVYECRVCTSLFTDPDSLKQHKRLHKGEKRYLCEDCGLRFTSRLARKNHMMSHSRELPFVCTEEGCGKGFRELGSLRAHQTTHSKPSHLCTQCGQVYKLRVSKHKCKVELPEVRMTPTGDDVLQQQPQQNHQHMGHQPAQAAVPPPPLPSLSQAPAPLPPPPPTLQTLSQTIPSAISQPLPQMNHQQALNQTIPQSLNQSVAQSLGQSVPQSLGQSLPQTFGQSAPQSLGQTHPHSLVQSTAQALGQSGPQSLGQSVPQSLGHSIPQSLGQSSLQALGHTIPQSLDQSIPQSLTQTISHSLPLSVPHSLPQSVPHSLPQSVPHSLPQSVPHSLPQSVPHSLPQTVPQPLLQPLSQPLPQPVPQTLSQSVPQTLPPAVPQLLPQHLPQSLSQALPQPLAQPGSSQSYMNNLMLSEPPPQSYVMEVEEAARAMRQNFGTADTVLVDPAYYNYIILYDRPVQQGPSV